MDLLNFLSMNNVALNAAGIVVVYYYCSRIRSLYFNIAAAKSTGFDYIILPFHIFGVPWIASQDLFLPLIRLLPSRWTQRWLP